MTRWYQRAGLQGGVVVLLALLTYANSFPGMFVLDDNHIVLNNPLLQHPDLVTIFRSDYWHGFAHTGLYRPVTILSLALNRMLTGEAAWGYHLVNVLLHAGVSGLLWSMLRRWGFSAGLAFWGAVLFAVHPLHTEVVDVVVGRSELLVALFLVAGFCLARSSAPGANPCVLGCFALALLAKEHAVVFLALLPLLDYFSQGRSGFRRRLGLYAALLSLTLVWLWWRSYGVVSPLPYAVPSVDTTPLVFVSTPARFLSGLLLQSLYLGKLVVPAGLQIFYATAELPPIVTSVFSVAGGLAVTALGLAGWLTARGWQRRAAWSLFALFYGISFLPTSNILIPIGVTFAERLAYFPSLWFCCGVVALVDGLAARFDRRLAWAAVGGYALVLAAVCIARNHAFTSAVRLYRAEVANNPADAQGWVNLAEASAFAERLPEAENAYLEALQLAPGDAYIKKSRALFLAAAGRRQDAGPALEQALAAVRARADAVDKARDLKALALAYLRLDEPAKTLELLDEAGDLLNTLELRGNALTLLGRDAEAVDLYRRLTPGMLEPLMEGETRFRFGLSLFRLGELEEARRELVHALKVEENAEGWNLLGVISARQGDWRTAARQMERAVALEPNNRHYQDNLQRARLRAGEP